jgi:hypothetical protein
MKTPRKDVISIQNCRKFVPVNRRAFINYHIVMKKLHFCLKELRRRNKFPLCLIWDQAGQTWKVIRPQDVQLRGYQQEDIIHRNYEV